MFAASRRPDGALGAVAAVAELHRAGKRLPFATDVVAFSTATFHAAARFSGNRLAAADSS